MGMMQKKAKAEEGLVDSRSEVHLKIMKEDFTWHHDR